MSFEASTPAPTMAAPLERESFGVWLSERLNPIIVKEVRQGLRTKVFAVCFALMLLACVVLACLAFADVQRNPMGVRGERYFLGFFSALAVVQFFIIPYNAFRSMAREREDETWVLLTLTGLGPRRILFGKLGSYLVQAALYGSAAAPFVIFSYYLNGIDLPTIMAILALSVAFLVFLTSLAVSMATVGNTRIIRAGAHLVVLAGLVGATAFGIAIATALSERSGGVLRQKEFLPAALTALWLMVTTGILLFEAAASRLAMDTENYAKGPRVAFLVQVFGSMALALYAWTEFSRPREFGVAMQVLMCLVVAWVGMMLVSDRDGMPPRLRAQGGFPLLLPGAKRAYYLVLLILGALTVCWMVVLLSSRGSFKERWALSILAAPGYVLLYLSLAVMFARTRLFRSLGSPVATRVCFILLVAVGSAAPPFLAMLMMTRPNNVPLNLFNPFIGVINFVEKSNGPGVAGLLSLWVVTAMVMGFALRALHRSDETA